MLERRASWFATTFGRSSLEREIRDELSFHLDTRIAVLVESGLPREEAVHRARLELGANEGYKEQCREA